MKKKITMISMASVIAMTNLAMGAPMASPMLPTTSVDPISIDTETTVSSKLYYNKNILDYKIVPHSNNVTIKTIENENYKANNIYELTYNPIDKTSPSTPLGLIFEFTTEQFENSGFESTSIYDIKKTDDFVYLVLPNMTLSIKYANSPEDSENYNTLLTNLSDAIVTNRLSTENNRVEGIEATYMFNLPEDMDLLAFYEANDIGALDKIVFKFSPMNRMEMPSTIMELYVFDRNDYKESEDMVKLKDANGLIFATKVYTENPYKVELDTKRYDEYVEMLTNNDYETIVNSLMLPQISDNTGAGLRPAVDNPTDSTKSEVEAEKTKFIVIDGKETEIEYVTIGEGRKGVPARAILEELGYEVSWDGNAKKISFVQGKISGDMTINSLEYNYLKMIKRMDMAPSIVNGSAIVPIEFLGQVLPYNYLIEADGNLYLNTNQ